MNVGIHMENCEDVLLENNSFLNISNPIVARNSRRIKASGNRAELTRFEIGVSHPELLDAPDELILEAIKLMKEISSDNEREEKLKLSRLGRWLDDRKGYATWLSLAISLGNVVIS